MVQLSVQTWDVVIVGSGPAGSAAAVGALTACPSASVLLLDRSDFPRDKCCGDAVLDAAFHELADHGVQTAGVVRGYPAVRDFDLQSVRGTRVRRPLPDELRVIPRVVLDARLRQVALDMGAQWRRHAVRRVRQYADRVEVDDLVSSGLTARILIGADGAESVVRKALWPTIKPRMAVAIRGYDRRSDGVPRMVFHELPGMSYAWRFPIGTGGANVGYGHEVRGRTANRQQLIETMRALLPDVDLDQASLRAHRLPLSTTRLDPAFGRVLLAGDAASLVNPITGEGIYYAISSGLATGRAAVLNGRHAAAAYRAELRRRYGRHQRHVALMSRLIQAESVLESGVRAAGRDQRSFEDISALGLGNGLITPHLVRHLAAAMVADRPPERLPSRLTGRRTEPQRFSSAIR